MLPAPKSHPENHDVEIRAFLERYTPKKRKQSEGHIIGRMSGELSKIAKDFDRSARHHPEKTAHKYNISSMEPSTNNHHQRKERRSKQNEDMDYDDKKTFSLRYRDSYNSINDKKNLSTFRTDKERRDIPSRSKDEPVKPEVTSFELLLRRNQKLAIRVGQLETACEALSRKASAIKGKCEDQVHKLESKYFNQMRQKVYFQKLAFYYKTKALEYMRLLEDNGIHVSNAITEDSLTEQSQLR